MSATVTDRLAELIERGKERRSRTREIRERSSLLLEQVHNLNARTSAWPTTDRYGADRPRTIARDASEAQRGVLGQAREVLGGDVLTQVETLLHEVDTHKLEHWSEDDARILVCLEEAWTAAARKGYTLEDLQAVLRAIGRQK